MKLLNEWFDTRYNVRNRHYILDSGLQILHTLNKQSLDSYASIILMAGTYFEKAFNVPNGTAHFLEHTISTPPNKLFKTEKAFTRYSFGGRNTPELVMNASTSFKYCSYWGYCHANREEDLIKVLSQTSFKPLDQFEANVEKQRKVILAELGTDLKPEKNQNLLFRRFALGNGEVYNTNFSILGEKESNIKAITTENLIDFYTNTYTPKNTIIAIQSPNELSPRTIKYIKTIDSSLSKNNNQKAHLFDESINTKVQAGYFHNTESQAITTHLLRFEKIRGPEYDYSYEIVNNFIRWIINFYVNRELRQNKGLIYGSVSYVNSNATWFYDEKAFKVTSDFKNLRKVINSIDDSINFKVEEFLESKDGHRWLENEISNYLFPHTAAFDPDYTDSKATAILRGFELYHFEKARTFVKDLTIDTLRKALAANTFKDSYMLWIDTNLEINKVKAVVEKTKAFQRITKG
ncbi:insulinase family protein [bacterium]|nr:insulinase family protein [bacterium]